MKTRDIDIRNSLHTYIENKFSYDKTTRIVNELQVCYGSARVDVAAINGAFHGYEIKSDRDTLERLPQQVIEYNKVFDYVTLVCSDKFMAKLDLYIPDWWGVYIAKPDIEDNVIIDKYREPSINNNLDPFSLVQFLKKDELVSILMDLGEDKKIKKLPKYKLWETLSNKCDVNDLRIYVRKFLKMRCI